MTCRFTPVPQACGQAEGKGGKQGPKCRVSSCGRWGVVQPAWLLTKQ